MSENNPSEENRLDGEGLFEKVGSDYVNRAVQPIKCFIKIIRFTLLV